jgi:hypothetical protein
MPDTVLCVWALVAGARLRSILFLRSIGRASDSWGAIELARGLVFAVKPLGQQPVANLGALTLVESMR